MKQSQVGTSEIPKNPFVVEDLRDKLALKKDYKNFKKTYSSKYPEIKAVNTNVFWNEKFKEPQNYDSLDLMTKEKIDTIISFLPNRKTRILDLGVGQGYLEQRLQEIGRGYELYGIDISEKAIARLNETFKGSFNVGDVLEIKSYYKNNYFDVIVAVELTEHISPRKILSFFRDIHGLLKPSGIFILSTPLNEKLRLMKENPSSHVREYTYQIINAELKVSGFKILEGRYFFAFKNLYSIKKIIAKLFPNWWEPNNVVVRAVKFG